MVNEYLIHANVIFTLYILIEIDNFLKTKFFRSDNYKLSIKHKYNNYKTIINIPYLCFLFY